MWRIDNGIPTKVALPEVKPRDDSPQIDVVIDDLTCPHCGKVYKVEWALEAHIETKH